MIIEEVVYLIMSKDRKLIARGTPRNRKIYHVDENPKNRFLTYSSKGRAEDAFKNSGFDISKDADSHIRKTNPAGKYLFWGEVSNLDIFEAVKAKVKYEEVL